MEDQRRKTGRYRLYPSVNGRATLEAFNRHEVYIDLRARTCSCRDFNKLKMLCRHAQQVCREENLDRELFISKFYTLDEYRATYLISLPPVLLKNLTEDLNCRAPPRQKTPGRPKKLRIRHKVRPTKPFHCGICGRDGHNRRTCAHQPEEEEEKEENSEDSENPAEEEPAEEEPVEEGGPIDEERELEEAEKAQLQENALLAL